MKRYVKWWEVKQYIDNLVERLKTDEYFHLEECSGIFTFPRGGFILATLLSYKLDLPILSNPAKNCIIIDDIIKEPKGGAQENFEQVRLNTSVKLHQALLKAEKFLTLHHQNPFAVFVQQVCAAAGFELYSVFEGEKGKTLVNMVALGMGVTLLMEQSIGENLDSKVVKVPIVPQVTQNLAFVRRKNVEHTPRQEKLWQALKESFAK